MTEFMCKAHVSWAPQSSSTNGKPGDSAVQQLRGKKEMIRAALVKASSFARQKKKIPGGPNRVSPGNMQDQLEAILHEDLHT